LAVFGSLISVVLSLVFLPNVKYTTPKTTPTEPPKKKRSFLDDLRHSGELAVRSSLWPLLMVKVLGGVTASMHSTALPLVLTQQLGFDPAQLGMSMSGSMFAVATFSAIGMAPLTKALGSTGMVRSGLIGRALLGCVMAAIVAAGAESKEALLVRIVAVSIFHALAAHVLATGLTTQTTGSVGKQEQGALLGLEHSLFSLARIGGPTLGTTLLATGAGLWSVETACGSLDIFLVVSLMAALSHYEKTKST
jgi:MFS family permease